MGGGLCLNLVISQKIVLANKIESHKIPNDAGNSFTTALLFYVLLFSMGFYDTTSNLFDSIVWAVRGGHLTEE